MNHKVLLLEFFLLLLKYSDSLILYQSTIPIQIEEVSGLHFDPGHLLKVYDHSLSACVRINYKRFKSYTGATILHFGDLNLARPFVNLAAGYPWTFPDLGLYLKEKGYDNWILRELPENYIVWTTNKWHHVCLSYSKVNSSVIVVKDGKVTNINMVDERLRNLEIPENFLDHIYVGRCVDPEKVCSVHAGDITDVNIWNRALSLQEMIEWTNCQNPQKGDLVNWDTAKWNVTNMRSYETSYDQICKSQALGPVIFPGLWNFTTSLTLCKNVRGNLLQIQDQSQQDKALELMNSSKLCSNPPSKVMSEGSWIAWWDVPQEGKMVSPFDSQNVLTKDSYQMWDAGEPNGETIENCVVLRRTGRWNDLDCGRSTCAICDMQETPVFETRGLCYGSSFDAHFGWTGEMSLSKELYSFRGFSKSIIQWDENQSEWRMSLYHDESIYATCNETGGGYPFGIFNWYFFNDTCPRAGKSETVAENTLRIPISFSACHKDEFSCRDGTCVNMTQVCDGQMNCQDKSDEVNCNSIIFDEAYLKYIQPPPLNESETQMPLEANVTIESILDLDEVNSLMKLQLKMDISWIDPRLEFVNLKEDANMNLLNLEQKRNLWLPEMIFDNNQDKQEANFEDNVSLGKIQMTEGASSTRSPLYELKNSRLIEGKYGKIVISKFFLVNFICTFKMQNYPFDNQRCYARIMMKGNTGHFVVLVAKNLTYHGPSDVMQYTIDGEKFYTKNGELVVEFLLGRRLLNVILTNITPTILIMIVTMSTNFYHEDHFKVVIPVNLTSLLVTVTLYIGVSSGLPRTSYLKIMDIWLIFSLLIPFINVLFHTYLDYLRMRLKYFKSLSEGKENGNEGWCDHTTLEQVLLEEIPSLKRKLKYLLNVMMFGMPAVFFIFSSVFFAFGIVLMQK